MAAAPVEGSAKIATQPLPDGATAEALSPRHRPPQSIILRSVPGFQAETVPSQMVPASMSAPTRSGADVPRGCAKNANLQEGKNSILPSSTFCC
jgi:hypothetical protein